MSIQGRLSDYSFLNVIAILANSKESGLLQIDYKWGQGLFYFDKGELASAQVGSLTGFSAVNVALSMEGTCSRFDSHCEPVSTQFSETSERLLLNRLVGMEVATYCDTNSLGDVKRLAQVAVPPVIPSSTPAAPVSSAPKTVTASPPPRTIAVPAEPEHPRDHVDLAPHFLDSAITQPSVYEKRRTLIFRAASILVLGFVAAAGIAVLRSKADTPASRPAPPQTSSKVTPETKPAPFSSRIDDKSILISPSTNTSKHPLPKNGLAENEPDKSAEAGSPPTKAPLPAMTTALPAEPANSEPPEEARKAAERAFKEISVVVKIENGHVVEAYIKNHQPGSESYESTALRIARRRVYPKDMAGTKTIVCSVSIEQVGSQQ